MIYPFYCIVCNYEEDFEFAMKDLPESIECPKCQSCMQQDISKKLKNTSTIIPDNFKAVKDNSAIKYGKPSRKRIF